MNKIGLFALIKPTMAFAFNKDRLIFLMAFPVLVLTGLMTASYFYPLFYLAETVVPEVRVNYYMLFSVVVLGPFCILSVMLKTQLLVFFGEDERQSKIFLPKPDKKSAGYFLVSLKIILLSLLISTLIVLTVIAIARQFVALPERIGMYALGASVLISPYFIVRFLFKLPAIAAGQPLGWIESWQMSRQINLVMAVLLSLFFVVPMLLSVNLYVFVRGFLHNEQLTIVLGNFFVMFALLFACILQAAYCGYLYSQVSSKV